MRKVLAFLFILVFVIPLVTAALVILPIRSWVLDRSFYAQALSGEQLSGLIQSSPSFPVKLELPIQFSQTTLDSLYAVIKKTITPEYLDSQIQPIIDSTLNLLEGKTSTLGLKLDLKPIKAAILGDKRDEVIQVLSQSIPVCPAGQKTPSQNNMDICRPASISIETFNKTFISPALTQVAQYLPDEYAVQTPQNLPMEKLFFWTAIFPGLTLPNMLSIATAIIAVLAFFFWFLSALIADSSWSARLKWLGGELIVPALIVLGLAALIQFINTTSLVNLGLNSLGGQIQLSPEVKTSIASISHSIASGVAVPFFISGGIALCSAIVLIVLGSIANPKKVEPEPTIQP
jgi:hypothetical protein